MILLFPFAKALRNGNQFHPKSPPLDWWKKLIAQLKAGGFQIVQVGVEGEPELVQPFYKNLSFEQLGKLIDRCESWIGIDSMGQHFCWHRGKYGIVVWGQSNPKVFGHPENVNLLKDIKYLRPVEEQFWLWEQAEFKPDAFVSPATVVRELKIFLNRKKT